MGRGRAKAKQTKVARELKYRSSTSTDLDALRAELAGGTHQPKTAPSTSAEPWDDEDGDETSSAYSSDGAFDDEAEDDWLPSPRRN